MTVTDGRNGRAECGQNATAVVSPFGSPSVLEALGREPEVEDRRVGSELFHLALPGLIDLGNGRLAVTCVCANDLDQNLARGSGVGDSREPPAPSCRLLLADLTSECRLYKRKVRWSAGRSGCNCGYIGLGYEPGQRQRTGLGQLLVCGTPESIEGVM